jgi:hypothetical protein
MIKASKEGRVEHQSTISWTFNELVGTGVMRQFSVSLGMCAVKCFTYWAQWLLGDLLTGQFCVPLGTCVAKCFTYWAQSLLVKSRESKAVPVTGRGGL